MASGTAFVDCGTKGRSMNERGVCLYPIFFIMIPAMKKTNNTKTTKTNKVINKLLDLGCTTCGANKSFLDLRCDLRAISVASIDFALLRLIFIGFDNYLFLFAIDRR